MLFGRNNAVCLKCARVAAFGHQSSSVKMNILLLYCSRMCFSSISMVDTNLVTFIDYLQVLYYMSKYLV